MILRISLSIVALVPFCLSCRGPSPGQRTSSSVSVLTYNIHHGAGVDGKLDLERIAGVIDRSGADLIALQEVDRIVKRTGNVDQLQVLAGLTRMHPAFARFMEYGGGEYGLAILSRLPIESIRRIRLPPGKAEPRSALAIHVDHPGLGSITFVCLHLDWLDDDTQRYAQAEALLAAIDNPTGIVILAGDFNDRPGSRTIRLMEKSFSNAAKPEKAHWTFPAPEPDHEIDFVMYRPMDRLEGLARVLDERVASDHRPVLAEIRRNRHQGSR